MVEFESRDDPGDAVLVAPAAEIQGVEIAGAIEPAGAGHAVGEAHVVVHPARDEEIVVGGITLTVESALASLRAACSSYGISTSGGTRKMLYNVVESPESVGVADNLTRCSGRFEC